MANFKKYGKLILFDGLAALCFVGVILFGWLPGPGGIPLLLLGLGFLAVNHDWAERWLETAKHGGVTIKKWLFPDKPWVRHTYDIGSVLLAILGVYLVLHFKNRILDSFGVVLVTFSLFVFLVNRDRFDKVSSLFKKKT
jgi:hypothetical protein